jgi:hypothetical protein
MYLKLRKLLQYYGYAVLFKDKIRVIKWNENLSYLIVFPYARALLSVNICNFETLPNGVSVTWWYRCPCLCYQPSAWVTYRLMVNILICIVLFVVSSSVLMKGRLKCSLKLAMVIQISNKIFSSDTSVSNSWFSQWTTPFSCSTYCYQVAGVWIQWLLFFSTNCN